MLSMTSGLGCCVDGEEYTHDGVWCPTLVVSNRLVSWVKHFPIARDQVNNAVRSSVRNTESLSEENPTTGVSSSCHTARHVMQTQTSKTVHCSYMFHTLYRTVAQKGFIALDTHCVPFSTNPRMQLEASHFPRVHYHQGISILSIVVNANVLTATSLTPSKDEQSSP